MQMLQVNLLQAALAGHTSLKECQLLPDATPADAMSIATHADSEAALAKTAWCER